jgi:hypothetical protein
MIWGIILFVIAAMSKAVADTLQHHFSISIFGKLNPKFWDPAVSSTKKLFWITKYRLDAWHLANSAMIVFIVLFGVYVKQIFPFKALDVIFYGLLWNGTFDAFYDHILKVEKWLSFLTHLKK